MGSMGLISHNGDASPLHHWELLELHELLKSGQYDAFFTLRKLTMREN